MARVGMGEPFVITNPEQAPETSTKFRKLIESPVLTGIEVDFGGFEVYHVEPPSIPDVLADRPVIVFGKWRGKPRGTISLKGYTGEHPFSKKVDVSDITPLKTNSALRYLWARHRIALLADYNRLHREDERVKEVTDLGLTYNLLTAYTSFVAVDTRVRLQDGQAVTVKQPLPLPLGVSDYAVGENRSFAGKSASSFAAAPLVSGMKNQVVEERIERKKEDSLACEPETDTSIRDKKHVELGSVTVADGLSDRSVQDLLKKHLHEFNRCYHNALKKQPRINGSVVFKITIDGAGGVLKVQLDKDDAKDKTLERCMLKKLKELQFPASTQGKNSVITVTFVLK
jgi:Ca-activated chloride channel family protein